MNTFITQKSLIAVFIAFYINPAYSGYTNVIVILNGRMPVKQVVAGRYDQRGAKLKQNAQLHPDSYREPVNQGAAKQ